MAPCASLPRRPGSTRGSTASRGSGPRSGSPRRPRAGHRLHYVAILYRATVTGGTLRDEPDGSTDHAEWVPLRPGRDAANRRPRRMGPGAASVAERCGRPSASTSRRRPSSSTASPATSRAGSACSPTTPAPRVVATRGRRRPRVRLRRAPGHRPVARRGRPGRLAQPDLARAGDPPTAVPPRGRRDEGHGRDLDDRARGRRHARRDRARLPTPGARVRRVRRPRLHAPDRRSDAGDDARNRRGPRRRRGRTPTMADMGRPARGLDHGRRRDLGDRDRAAGVPRGPASERLAGEADRPLRSVPVPVAGRRPGRRLRSGRLHGRAGDPRPRPVLAVRPRDGPHGDGRRRARPGRGRGARRRADRDLPRLGAGRHRVRRGRAREVPRARACASVSPTLALAVFGGAAPANLGIALDVRGPILSTANSCASRRRRDRRGDGRHPDRRDRRGDRGRRRDARCRRSRSAPSTSSGRSGAATTTTRRTPRGRWTPSATGSSWARARRCWCWRRPRPPAARGAQPYAEVMGYGATSDAHHMVQPRADGREAAPRDPHRARRCRGRAADIDWVSAHASSTPIGDIAEARAIAAGLGAGRRHRPRERHQGA